MLRKYGKNASNIIRSSHVGFIQDLKLPIFSDHQLHVEIQFQDKFETIRKRKYTPYTYIIG